MAEVPGSLQVVSVPVAELEPFPNNPRRGDVKAVVASLRRFGQRKPIVIDGRRIVAGHHVVEAARELGWVEVQAVDHEFGSEDEQRAFLLADNRTADLGAYDSVELAEHLRILSEIDRLDGTGYTADDLDALLADIYRTEGDVTPPAGPVAVLPRAATTELVLLFSEEQRAEIERWLAQVAAVKGTSGVSETVYAALQFAADRIT